MHLFYTNILIYDVSYMLWTRRFIFRKTVHTGLVRCVVPASVQAVLYVEEYRTHSCICKTAYTYACKTYYTLPVCRGQLKCDGTCAETRFRLLAKRTSPFKSVGVSVQSTTGTRGVHISGSNAGYTLFRGSVKGTGYTLHSPVSPSLPLPCFTVCHHISTRVYNHLREDEPLGSKHVEDIINYNISLEKEHFVGFYCIIILQWMVQKT